MSCLRCEKTSKLGGFNAGSKNNPREAANRGHERPSGGKKWHSLRRCMFLSSAEGSNWLTSMSMS